MWIVFPKFTYKVQLKLHNDFIFVEISSISKGIKNVSYFQVMEDYTYNFINTILMTQMSDIGRR